MKNSIQTLILSSFLTLNLMGSAPAPIKMAIELTPEEIEMLSEYKADQYAAVKRITNRGIDLVVLDAYLANDHRFNEAYARIFKTLTPAIYYLNLPLFEHVLIHHPDAIEKIDYEGNSPLNKVLERRSYNYGEAEIPVLQIMIKLLVNHGADIESPYIMRGHNFGTPLLQAINAAESDIVEFLVLKGANINARDSDGKTALELAKQKRQYAAQHMSEISKGVRQFKQKTLSNYDKIIALLENYKKSRLENRTIQQDRRLPVEVHSLITECTLASHAVPPAQGLRPYISAPKSSAKQVHAQRIALNEVKQGLKNNNLEPLEDFITAYPKSLNAQDKAGDSLLLIAIKAQNSAAVEPILETLTQLDQTENNVNERLTKALGHKNLYGNNAYDVAQETKNEEIIEILKPYYNAPEMAPNQGE